MPFDDGVHVWGAAVAHFYVVFVENCVKFVVFVEVFLDKLEEGVGDVCFYVLVERRVEPYGFSLAVSFGGFRNFVLFIVELWCVPVGS